MTAFTKFDYLLNAMMRAAQHERPALQDYKGKRAAVLQYVADQSALIARCREALSMPCDRWNQQQSLIVRDLLEAIAKDAP